MRFPSSLLSLAVLASVAGSALAQNDNCGGAISVVNGPNGPYSNVGASTSSPAWPCAIGGADVWYSYVALGAGNLTVDVCGASYDSALEIFDGSAGCGALVSLGCNDDSCALQSSLTVAVTTGTQYFIRVGGYASATGSFTLNVNGPAGGGGGTVIAQAQAYGQGCYRTSRSFYENFTTGTLDLANSAFTLINQGNAYVALPFGAYVVPTAAATSLGLGDDTSTTVTLPGTMPYPGGVTTALEVCSNGFVSAATGNGTGYTPNVGLWLNSLAPRWGGWHDYNPGATGSGAVKSEQVGNILYITWDGVYDFGGSTPNTWQLQFDTASGNVTFAWQGMSGGGNGHLVGYAAGGTSNDVGSIDISAQLPSSFGTSPADSNPLTLSSGRPVINTTFALTTTNVPAASAFAFTILSFTQLLPAQELSAFGMPGCYQHVGFDAVNPALAAGGTATLNVSVPNNPSLVNVVLTSQSIAFAPGVNLLGALSSNGIRLSIGNL